jgi:uncharacterized membrane protein
MQIHTNMFLDSYGNITGFFEVFVKFHLLIIGGEQWGRALTILLVLVFSNIYMEQCLV